MSYPVLVRPQPSPTRRAIALGLTAGALARLLLWPASGWAQTKSTLVDPPPAVDVTSAGPYMPTNADGTPNLGNMGIDPAEYTYCQICSPTVATANVAGCPTIVGTQHDCQAYCHVTDDTVRTYSSNPPHSGRHRTTPERGISEHTSVVDRGNYVHSMEHGAVVLLYNCPGGCSAELDKLRQVQKTLSAPGVKLPVFITPDPKLPAGPNGSFAAAAWTWTLRADSVDVAAFTCFVRQHALNGRECENQKCPYFQF